jgi:hypothetical protein
VGKGERKKSGGLALCRRLREATQADCAGFFWSMTPSHDMIITSEVPGDEVLFLHYIWSLEAAEHVSKS